MATLRYYKGDGIWEVLNENVLQNPALVPAISEELLNNEDFIDKIIAAMPKAEEVSF